MLKPTSPWCFPMETAMLRIDFAVTIADSPFLLENYPSSPIGKLLIKPNLQLEKNQFFKTDDKFHSLMITIFPLKFSSLLTTEIVSLCV